MKSLSTLLRVASLISILTLFSCVSSDPRDHSYKVTHINDAILDDKDDYVSDDYQAKKYLSPLDSLGLGYDEDADNLISNRSTSEPDGYFSTIIDQDLKRYKRIHGQYDGYFKIGKPYRIYGILYHPKNYQDYEEMGTASWYGKKFHGKLTANGEIYDMESMTAAHRTLPLPSLVRVTNLNNNISVIVRVNDRGPYAKNRIIDVSHRAASMLGFKSDGTTTVKIELLREETDNLLTKLNLI